MATSFQVAKLDIEALVLDLMRLPFVRGGRGGDGIDCYGAVLAIAARMGLPLRDCWLQLEHDWQHGRVQTSTGFPDGWVRWHKAPVVDGDVVLMGDGFAGVGIVFDAHVITATRRHGVVRVPLLPPDVVEIWRFTGGRSAP